MDAWTVGVKAASSALMSVESKVDLSDAEKVVPRVDRLDIVRGGERADNWGELEAVRSVDM